MTLEQLKMEINQVRYITEDMKFYRLLTLSIQALEKLEDKLDKDDIKKIEIRG